MRAPSPLRASSFVVSLLPGACAWGLVAVAAAAAWQRSAAALAAVLVLTPASLALTFLVVTALVQVLLPRLRPGRFAPGGSAGFIAWSLHRGLEDGARRAGLFYLLRSFYLLRFLWARALGGRVALQVNASLDASWSGLPLIEVGRATTLGLGSSLCAWRVDDEAVTIGPIVVGAGVFIGADTTIGPGTSLGEGAWVGFGNALVAEEVPAGTKIADRERDPGPPSSASSSPGPSAAALPAEGEEPA